MKRETLGIRGGFAGSTPLPVYCHTLASILELPQQNWQNRFDLIVMTGHAFQTIVADLDITTFLAAVRNCLVPSGVFAFESRNPSVRAWERWTPEKLSTVQMQDGTVVEIITELTSGFECQRFLQPCLSRGTSEPPYAKPE